MDSKSVFILFLLMFTCFIGCAAQQKVATEPPPLPEGVLNARWGMSVDQAKEAVPTFQDDTAKPPFALYASGTYFDRPAIVSYFFTPRTKKLYRADVTYNDPGIYGAVKDRLVQTFRDPSFSRPDRDVWLWKDSSMLILQKDPSRAQISYSSGPLLKVNEEETEGPAKAPSRPSSLKTIFQW